MLIYSNSGFNVFFKMCNKSPYLIIKCRSRMFKVTFDCITCGNIQIKTVVVKHLFIPMEKKGIVYSKMKSDFLDIDEFASFLEQI